MSSILIADDHPIVLEGLVGLFQGSDYSVAARCKNGEEVLEALARDHSEILLLDVNMPAPGGIEIAQKLRKDGHPAKIILLTSSIDEDQIMDSIRLGIDGIILKESAPQQLVTCLDTVRDGGQWLDPEVARRAMTIALKVEKSKSTADRLAPRELEVVRSVARGLSNKEIARELKITEGTVKVYLHGIYQKLGVGNRVELVNAARDRALL